MFCKREKRQWTVFYLLVSLLASANLCLSRNAATASATCKHKETKQQRTRWKVKWRTHKMEILRWSTSSTFHHWLWHEQLSYFVWFVFLHCMATGGQHLHHEFTWGQAAKTGTLTHTHISLMLFYHTHSRAVTSSVVVEWQDQLSLERKRCLEVCVSVYIWVCTSECASLETPLQQRTRPSPFPSQLV